MMIYIYVYVCVFSSPVNPLSGIIKSGQLNYSNFEYQNIPGKDFNVIDITEQQFLKKNKIRSLYDYKSISILLWSPVKFRVIDPYQYL